MKNSVLIPTLICLLALTACKSRSEKLKERAAKQPTATASTPAPTPTPVADEPSTPAPASATQEQVQLPLQDQIASIAKTQNAKVQAFIADHRNGYELTYGEFAKFLSERLALVSNTKYLQNLWSEEKIWDGSVRWPEKAESVIRLNELTVEFPKSWLSEAKFVVTDTNDATLLQITRPQTICLASDCSNTNSYVRVDASVYPQEKRNFPSTYSEVFSQNETGENSKLLTAIKSVNLQANGDESAIAFPRIQLKYNILDETQTAYYKQLMEIFGLADINIKMMLVEHSEKAVVESSDYDFLISIFNLVEAAAQSNIN